MPYTVTPFVFDDYWENVQNELGTTIMDVLFYGIFLVLFLVAMHLLYHRITSPGRKPLLVLTTAMALLATTQFSLHIASTSLALRLLHRAVIDGQGYVPDPPGNGLEHVYWSLVMTQDLVLVTNTVFTDGLLTYRCYLVWGRPHKIFLVVPMLLILATLATGYVTSYDQDYYSGSAHFDARIVFTMSLFTNFALMILTAGRIWWVTRTQRAALGREFTSRYDTAIAIILESGAIYCFGIILQVIALSVQDSFPTAVYLTHGVIGQVINIVPTLIIVRVGMGHSIPTTVPSESILSGQSGTTTSSRTQGMDEGQQQQQQQRTRRPLTFAPVAAASRSNSRNSGVSEFTTEADADIRLEEFTSERGSSRK